MKKNKIKILSVIVLLLFASSFAMPFFEQENCDMPVATNSALHCDMDMPDMDCCEAIIECVVVVVLPIVSAPLNKVELQKDLIVDYFISYIDNLELIEEFSFIQENNELSCIDVHPGFQTPLLV